MATFYASKTGEVSAREKEHSALVRELAGECMTLLENDGTLPLAGAGKVAVYGNGVRHTVKGGTGSGDVNTRTVVTIEQGLKEAGFEILTGKWLDEYDKVLADAQAAYQAELAKKAEELHVPIFAVMFSEAFAQPDVPAITEKEDTDTAIYVLSRNSGEGADRYNRACDYLLGENELADIAYLAEHYEKTVLILNIANLVDTTELKKIKGLNAILLAGQAGNATGNIVADVVLGKSIPSGKLTDTWAASYEDYPSSKNFSHNNGDTNDEYYSDGIYVGYRYFDSFGAELRWPFGYGLGYGTCALGSVSVGLDGTDVTVSAEFEAIQAAERPNVRVEGVYVYDGSEQTADVRGVDASMNITGDTGTNAGDYTVVVTSRTGQWADGSPDAVPAAWSIGKANQGAPAGLRSTAPGTEGGSDGKITGEVMAKETSQNEVLKFATEFEKKQQVS